MLSAPYFSRMTMTETISSTGTPMQNLRLTARALLLGDRLDVAGLERSDVLSTTPLAFRAGQDGFVALFRYGVAVLVGLTPLEEDEVIRSLRQRIVGASSPATRKRPRSSRSRPTGTTRSRRAARSTSSSSRPNA